MRTCCLLAVWLALGLIGGLAGCTKEESMLAPYGPWLAGRPGWEPPAGLPVPGAGGTPEPAHAAPALTTAELIELAYKVHPPLDLDDPPPEIRKGMPAFIDPGYRQFWSVMPQLQAQSAVRALAWKRIDTFHQLMRAVRPLLPPGPYKSLEDRTMPHAGVAYSLVLNYNVRPDETIEHQLVVQMSWLAPLYDYFVLSSGQLWEHEQRHREVPAELVPALAAVERELAARFGYRRIDPRLAETPVPGIYLMRIRYEPRVLTLADALFGSLYP